MTNGQHKLVSDFKWSKENKLRIIFKQTKTNVTTYKKFLELIFVAVTTIFNQSLNAVHQDFKLLWGCSDQFTSASVGKMDLKAAIYVEMLIS